ncbi:GNAT family N-acetyltransferase [Kitasatospora sp. NBC_00458]|uniref:GNAT family N-acetyltransferase n=1 Tax=Kitasatospora sp. NBC_00458 TaxID=2903568 RepID=UPI002E199FC7
MTDLAELPPLPGRYRTGPAAPADAPAVHRLVAACERDLLGRTESAPDDVAADLAQPGLDTARDTLLVRDGRGEVAGWAWVRGGRRSRVDVHPGHRGAGLGGWLLDWTEERARRAGGERLAQAVEDGDRAAVALLRSRGYRPFVHQWQLGIGLPAGPVAAAPPDGVSVRPFRPGDERAAYRVAEDAFDEWQVRRSSYEEWALRTVGRDSFAPALSRVALAGGEMVGVVLSLDVPGSGEGFVERLAVRRDHRNRGIARLLLGEVFGAFHRHGRELCTLWTHSETGALSLYERLGMTVRRTSSMYGKALAGAVPPIG